MQAEKIFKLTIYIPDSHLELVKMALFGIGLGTIGHYDCCCWQVKGIGQYRPLLGANPFLGEENKLETVEEWRVEMLCSANMFEQAKIVIHQVHPYETPAYDWVEVYL